MTLRISTNNVRSVAPVTLSRQGHTKFWLTGSASAANPGSPQPPTAPPFTCPTSHNSGLQEQSDLSFPNPITDEWVNWFAANGAARLQMAVDKQSSENLVVNLSVVRDQPPTAALKLVATVLAAGATFLAIAGVLRILFSAH